MKKVILVHGWNGSPEEGWKPWLKNELEKQGFDVIVPAMPNPQHPNRELWLSKLEEVIGVPDDNLYFVGHSLGCIAVMRYLESLGINQKVAGVILVAGFTSNNGFPDFDSFFQSKIDWNLIKSNAKKFVAIHSTNDPYVSMHYSNFFKENLGAEIIVEQNKGHFFGDDGVLELPSVLESLIKM